MEALQSQRLLIQAPSFPAAGYGSGSSFATNVRAGRVALSSSALPCQSSRSFAPAFTSAMYEMNCTRDRSLCTTSTAGNWVSPRTSPSSTREPRFRAGYAGNWSSFRSSSSSSSQDFRELLLVASHTPGSSGRAYSVIITSTPFDLWQRRASADSWSFKTLKISSCSIFYWLKRKRKDLLEAKSSSRVLSSGYHWRAPVMHRFFRYTSSSSATSRAEVFLGSARSSTSDCYNGYSGVSSQAEGNTTALEDANPVDQQQQERLQPNGERQEFIATRCGWRVRDASRWELRDLRRVADIQTDAFHEKSAVFNDLFYNIFHAEVLSSLQYKARHSELDRYSCLLAERDPTHLDSLEGNEPTIVGAVDVAAFADKKILCHLPGVEEYLYVSGMAVESDFRRQGVATSLLEGCLARALEWGFDYLVLHAYEDDLRAINLYSRAGYNTISVDPSWMSKFFGQRRRVAMAKRTHERLDSS